MNRLVRKFKVVGETAYLNDGSILPMKISGVSSIPIHGDERHSQTFVTQTEIDNSIRNHSLTFDHLFPIVNHDTNVVLALTDLQKIHVMDVAAGDRHFTLPDVGATEVGEWVILARKGVTNILRVIAHASDVIFNSDPGGMLECSDADHDYSAMELIVMDTGVWGNPSFGIWSTR